MGVKHNIKYNKEKLEIAKRYLVEVRATSDMVPYIEELAERLDVVEKTVYNWTKKYPEFNEVVEALKNKQKLMLRKLGLSKEVATAMAIFELKANHGMVETERKEITGKDGAPITGYKVEVVDNNDKDD